jgi:5-methylcytosine-specific restriction endonuclease McrA
MTGYCFVLDSSGQHLSPTKENKGWFLIRKKRAMLINKFPMVIQLTKTVLSEEIDQTPIHLGIDDGSKYTGIALVQECRTKNKPVFKGTIEQRNDVKHLMDVRRGYRSYKRGHKRYRPKRYSNRASSKRKGRIAPSIKQKREVTLRVVKKLQKWCRINLIHLEDVAINIRALQEGYKLYKWQYQKSNRLDENLRKAVLIRDKFACQDCGKKDCRLEVHHVTPRRFKGNDSIYNLIALCEHCHGKITGIEMTVAAKYYAIIKGRNVNFKDAQHVMQGKTFLREELKKISPVVLTTGGDTANKRIDWNIDKTHVNDAIVISDLKIYPKQCEMKDWIIKPMRRKSKAKAKEVSGFKHRDFVCYTKKNGEKYIGYITALYPKKKECNLTTTDGKVLKRYGLKSMKLLWSFNKIYWF